MQTSIKIGLLLLFTEDTDSKGTHDALIKQYQEKDFVQINGRWYFFTDPFATLYSIEEAILLCELNGVVLGSVETEDIAIRGWLSDQGWGVFAGRGFGTSGRRIGNLWMWTSTGKLFTYTAWRLGQPDDTSTDSCMDLQGDLGWFDWDCLTDTPMMFFCEQSN
ncbi:hypothetical protein B566_EDAN014016 [Ephemera danica]|nr:hypothetical protein B566_EDAN014016 [Ephemera danica]